MPPANPQDAVAAARELLPAWVVWGNDLALGVTVALAVGGLFLAVWFGRRPWHSRELSHWTERARRAYAVRLALRMGAPGLPLMILLFCRWVKAPFSPLPRPALGLALSLFVFFVALYQRWRAERQLGLPLQSFMDSLRHVASWAVVCVPHVSIGLALMPFAPPEFDHAALLLVTAAVTISLLLIQGGVRFRLARWLGLAASANDCIAQVVRRAAERAGTPVPGAIVLRTSLPEIMAFRSPYCISITDGAASLLTDAELEAICTHQLTFLNESKWGSTWRTLVLAVAAPLVFPAIWPTVGTFGAAGLLILMVAFLALGLVLTRVTLRLVQRVQRQTADFTGAAERARALERVCELSLIPVVVQAGSTVPTNVYDRVVAAGVTPDYRRPRPPSRLRILAAIFLPLGPPMVAFMLWAGALSLYVHPAPSDQLAQEIGVILPGNEEWSLYNLAHIRFDAGVYDAAITMLRATTEINATAWQYPAFLAGILSFTDRCDEARAVLHEARRRLSADPSATPAERISLEELSENIENCFERSRQRPPLPQPDAVAAVVPFERPW